MIMKNREVESVAVLLFNFIIYLFLFIGRVKVISQIKGIYIVGNFGTIHFRQGGYIGFM